jgi:aspartyl protease family protein
VPFPFLPVLLLLCLLCAAFGALAAEISVVGLSAGKAVLVIDGGRPRTLAVGQTSPEGVKLISSSSDGAVVEHAGKRLTLTTGSTGFGMGRPAAGGSQVVLTADSDGHFLTTGTINGVSVRFLVDTGATVITMSSLEARRLGVNYLTGVRGRSQTVNGVVPVYRVKLDTVQVGEVTANNVDASVLDSDSLPIVLLGMSFLNRMEMRRDGLTMTLTKRY